MSNIDTGTDEVLCDLSEGVATITLNRPDKRNALSDTLTPALRQILLDLDNDPRCGAVVLTGAGSAFCAGGDVSGMGKGIGNADPLAELRGPEDKIKALTVRQETLTLRLHELSKPTIAALPGPAAGAGLSIALACDMRIMADSAFITTAFANIGLSGDYGCAWFLTQLLGPSRAKELMLTARRVQAAECLSLGLANQVVAFDDLQTEARTLALQLGNSARTALRFMKENINRAVWHDLRTCLAADARGIITCAATDDHKEAVNAFIEKRKPNFNHPQ